MFVGRVLGDLKMPSLHSFVLSVDFDKDYVQDTVVNAFESNERFSKIQSFELRMYGKAAMGTRDVRDIFCYLHSLRNLSIVAPIRSKNYSLVNFWRDTEIYGPSYRDGLFVEDHDLPPLETLRLRGNGFNPKFIMQIREEYERKKSPWKLKSLILKNCRCFDDEMDALYGLVPPHNIICLDGGEK